MLDRTKIDAAHLSTPTWDRPGLPPALNPASVASWGILLLYWDILPFVVWFFLPTCCCSTAQKHYSHMHTVHSNLTTFDASEPQLEHWDLGPHFGEPQLEHWDHSPSTFEHTGSLLTQSRSSFAATKSIPPAIRAGARSGFSPSVVVASPLVITSSSLAIQRYICAPRPSPGALRLVESFYNTCYHL